MSLLHGFGVATVVGDAAGEGFAFWGLRRLYLNWNARCVCYNSRNGEERISEERNSGEVVFGNATQHNAVWRNCRHTMGGG